VRYVPISPDAAADAVRKMAGDEWQAEATRGYFRAYAADWGDFTTDWVRQISGHAARSFADFAHAIMVTQGKRLDDATGRDQTSFIVSKRSPGADG
jgi:hypothetical protein